MNQKELFLRRVLLLFFILLCPAVWAQEPFLTIDMTGKEYPYEVPEEYAALVFEKSDVTIAVELTPNASMSGRGCFVCVADPAAVQRSAAVGNAVSEYYAFGHYGSNPALLKSSRSGDRYSANGLSMSAGERFTLTISLQSNAYQLYKNADAAFESRSGAYIQTLGAYTGTKKLYIGGGMVDNAAFEQCDATIHSVSFYEGNYTGAQIMDSKSSLSDLPVHAVKYYLFADTYQNGEFVNRFFYANGSNLAMNTSLSVDAAYQWTCTITSDGGYQFQNGNGKYLAHKALSESAHSFTLSKSTHHTEAGAVQLYTAGSTNRYFVVKNDGSGFDQSTITYDQTGTAYCTDFVFIPVNEVKTLRIVGDSPLDAYATWNGLTKKLPASWIVKKGDVITSSALSETHEAAYKFNGFFEDGNSVTEVSELTDNRTITADYSLDIFSSSYGEKWVDLSRASAAGHVAMLTASGSGTNPVFSSMDRSQKGMVWCLVGDENNFKIYNYLSGSALALTPSGTPSNGVGVHMTDEPSASSWALVEYSDGYAICPSGNSDYGINSYGGSGSLGGQLKFYAASDAGTHWNFTRIDVDKPLTLKVDVEGISSPRVAEMTLTIGSISSTTRLTGDSQCTYYLPMGEKFSLGSMTYRGYSFAGFTDAEGNTVEAYNNALLPTGGLTATANYTATAERTLYYTPDANNKPYRIPAIATAPNGHIFAIADNRPCGNDIGYGEVDIKCRISTDNGVTWGDEFFVADGQGGSSNVMSTGFGDAAVIADCEQNKLLVMMVCGRTVCHNGQWTKDAAADADNINRVARVYATYNDTEGKWEWTQPVEVTNDIYSIFLDAEDNPTVTSMFIGSGKICQSRVVKKGSYYRLYCSIWTKNGGNRVIYSDNFGESWSVLGTIDDRPAPNGDEPKCEELPDGSVILSSRKGGGRYFNIFTFADDTYTTGEWGTVVSSNNVTNGLSFGGNSTNGEIMLVDAVNAAGENKKLLLQSIPTGSGRSNVALFYKEIDESTTYTPTTLATGWTKGIEMSNKYSAYSTMTLQKDSKVGFLFEEEPGGYCIIYSPLSINTITADNYFSHHSYMAGKAREIAELKGVGYPTADAASRTALLSAINTFESSYYTAETVSALNAAIDNYKSSTTDIQLPEDGKTYTITFSTRNANYADRYINFNGTTLVNVGCDGNELPTSAHFVFRKFTKDGNTRYAMVPAYNSDGKYLTYQTVTEYTAGVNDFQVIPLIGTTAGNVSDKTSDNLFGYVYFKFDHRNSNNTRAGVYIMKEENGNFDNSDAPFLNGTYTSALIIKEVEYPNIPTLNPADNIEGVEAIATFSAPFATIVPEGVTAYYAKSYGDGEVNMQAIEGAIPANQGVLLTGSAGKVIMAPATAEAQADVTGNMLEHSAGADKFIASDVNAYILGKGTKGVGYYKLSSNTEKRTLGINKSYLVLPSSASFAKIRFNRNVTSIDAVENDVNTNGAVYDLCGRRITTPAKGGIYIKNGKKFLVR